MCVAWTNGLITCQDPDLCDYTCMLHTYMYVYMYLQLLLWASEIQTASIN